MSVEARREREDARLRRKILKAALQVFAAEGYERVSMRKIAARIDYSATTIYRFFASKEELLRTIASETYRELSVSFEEVKTRTGRDPIALLEALLVEYIGFCVKRPEMYRMYSDLASFEMEDGVMYERIGTGRYVVFQSLFECIRQAGESGSLDPRDDAEVFLYLWDAVSGYIDHRISHPRLRRGTLPADAAAYVGMVIRGVERRDG